MTSWSPYPEYKPSGVEWLGKIPAHWDLMRLKSIASVQFSNVDKHTTAGEVPVRLCNYTDVYYNDSITPDLELMSATATPHEISKFRLRKHDVIVTKDSETADDIAVPAYVVMDATDIVCGYHLAQVRPRHDIVDGRYLFWSFCSGTINDQFSLAATGVTRFGLGKHGLDNASFYVPPLPEQRAIAAFLDRQTERIDTLIALKERQIELLQEKRAALISHAVTKGLDPDMPMKDSGIEWLGEIPVHWGVVRSKVIFTQVDERSESGDEELLTVSHITGVTPRSDKNVTMFMAETLANYKKCQAGDLVINTMWAWMGALGVAPQGGIVSPSYHVYRPHRGFANTRYYDRLFRTEQFVAEITRFSKGVWTSRLRLYPEEFLQIRVPCPPVSEQNDIADYLDREAEHTSALVAKIQSSIDTLREYRTALISAAVTGKIDVREEVSGCTDRT